MGINMGEEKYCATADACYKQIDCTGNTWVSKSSMTAAIATTPAIIWRDLNKQKNPCYTHTHRCPKKQHITWRIQFYNPGIILIQNILALFPFGESANKCVSSLNNHIWHIYSVFKSSRHRLQDYIKALFHWANITSLQRVPTLWLTLLILCSLLFNAKSCDTVRTSFITNQDMWKSEVGTKGSRIATLCISYRCERQQV